jgi:predicted DNA-binding transcriptional regulator AlpA
MQLDRDAIPDYAERSRRMGDLIAAHALPVAEVALFLDLPLSTIDKLRMQGKGPKCFKLGRRLYVLQGDLRAWLDNMATSAEAAPKARL